MSDLGSMSEDHRVSSPPDPSLPDGLAITTTMSTQSKAPSKTPSMDGAALRADFDRIIDPTL